MAIDRPAVDHVARLARLDLSEQERDRMSAELARILEHAELIRSLDLDGIEPTAHPLPLVNAFRPDEAGPSLGAEEALRGAPLEEGGCFRVPRIIEEP